jgi:hypothetical protein
LQPGVASASYYLLMLYPKDPKVRVERHEETLKIEWRWGSNSGYIMVVIAIGLAIAVWFSGQITYQNDLGYSIWTRLGFFVGVNAITTFPLILIGLTSALNKTMIQADKERLLVRVGPIRWIKPKELKAGAIQQFFVGGHSSGQPSISKSLYLLDQESHYVLLTSTFPSSFAAHQICHELLDWYGLEDLPVYGESSLPHNPGPRVK